MERGGDLAGKAVVEGAAPRGRPDSAVATGAEAGVVAEALGGLAGRSPKSITLAGAPPVGGAPAGSAGTVGGVAGAGAGAGAGVAGAGAGVAGGAGVGVGRVVEVGATEGSGVERGAEVDVDEVGGTAGVGVEEAGAWEPAGAGMDRAAALPDWFGAGSVTGGNPGFWKGADPSPKREGAGAMPPKGGGDLAGKLVMLGSLITPGVSVAPGRAAGGTGAAGRVWAPAGGGVEGTAAGCRGTPAPGSGAVVPPLEGSLMMVACFPPKPPTPMTSSAAGMGWGYAATSNAARAGRASNRWRGGGGDVTVMTSGDKAWGYAGEMGLDSSMQKLVRPRLDVTESIEISLNGLPKPGLVNLRDVWSHVTDFA